MDSPDTDGESRYARLLEQRFRLLRFSPALEGEFRAHHLRAIRTRVIACFLTCIALSIALTIRNHGGDGASAPPELIDHLRVWVLRPITLMLVVTVFVPSLFHKAWLAVTPPALVISGSIGAYSVAGLVAGGNAEAFFSMVIGLFGVYLLMGLLFWQLLTVGLALVVTYTASLVFQGAPADVVQYQCALMLAVTTLAAVFDYTLEHSQRTAFLQRRTLEEIGRHDALTGLQNRRAFDEAIAVLWQQGMRDRQPIGLLLLDVDHFKLYNDHYGHQAGDRCLAQIGAVLRQTGSRPFDIAARVGGEEFALMRYGCTREHLEAMAEHIRAGIEALDLPHAASPTGAAVTVSIGGVLVQPVMDRTPQGMLQFADESLYEAKHNGRDQVVIRTEEYANVVTGAFRTKSNARRDM